MLDQGFLPPCPVGLVSVFEPAPDAVNLAISPYLTSFGAEYFESLLDSLFMTDSLRIHITSVSGCISQIQANKRGIRPAPNPYNAHAPKRLQSDLNRCRAQLFHADDQNAGWLRPDERKSRS